MLFKRGPIPALFFLLLKIQWISSESELVFQCSHGFLLTIPDGIDELNKQMKNIKLVRQMKSKMQKSRINTVIIETELIP